VEYFKQKEPQDTATGKQFFTDLLNLRIFFNNRPKKGQVFYDLGGGR
jgi:hypothetical protein